MIVSRRLSDIAEFIVDCEHKTAPLVENGIPSVRTTDLKNGRIIFESCNKVSEVTYREWTNRLEPQHDDLILSREAPVGEIGIIPANTKLCLGQRTVLIRVNKKKIEPRFLLYLFLTSEIRHELICRSEGSVVPHLNMSDIRSFPLPDLPSIEIQRRIADILGSLDNKIELNRLMNETLEAMARAIFKSWFVDFDPVRAKAEGRQPAGMDAVTAALFPDSFEVVDGRELPKGWGIGKVSDLGHIICGKTPPTKDPDNYGNDMLFITIPDMHNQIFILDTSKNLSKTGVKTQSNKTLPPMSICVSCIASPGLVAITSKPSQTNQQINSIIPFDKKMAFYCYYVLLELSDEIKSSGSGGSVIDNLNKGDFSSLSILHPTEEILERFHCQVDSLFLKILVNQEESRTLAQIRDALLPKLMSGEIQVSSTKESIKGVKI